MRVFVYSLNMRRFDVFERDNFTCIYCGYSAFDNDAELHGDHVVPVALGGKNVASNMATACWRCNIEKSDRSLKQTEEALAVVAERNAEAGIDSSARYYPTRRARRDPVSPDQRMRNKLAIRSLTHYIETEIRPDTRGAQGD